MSGIVWLASYPKSGNTWLRVFFANLVADTDDPVSINALGHPRIASSRRLFDDIVGIESSELTRDEVRLLRPRVYERMARELDTAAARFVKIHDAFTRTDDGVPIIPVSTTPRVIYIVRNPLDVAVSFAHHSGDSVDVTIERMCDEQFRFGADPSRLHEQLDQALLSWSGHVTSWVDEPSLEVFVLRYEDMHERPDEVFRGAAQFAGVSCTAEQIARAIKQSSFEELSHQEAAHGFAERSARADRFFREGKTGGWREVLTEQQIDRLVGAHGPVMLRFGYTEETQASSMSDSGTASRGER